MARQISKQRKPKFMYLERGFQLEQLVPGDLVTIAFGDGTFDPRIHCVYEGSLKTDFNKIDGIFETDSTAHEMGFAFLNLDHFLSQVGSIKTIKKIPRIDLPPIFSYRIKGGNIGQWPNTEIKTSGTIYIINGSKGSYAERTYYPSEKRTSFIEDKLKLLRIGERLVRKLYTFDRVVYVDELRRPLKEVKNKCLYHP